MASSASSSGSSSVSSAGLDASSAGSASCQRQRQRQLRQLVGLAERGDLDLHLVGLHVPQWPAEALAMVVRLQACSQRGDGDHLQIDVERCLDTEAAAQHTFTAEALVQVAANELGEVGRRLEVVELGLGELGRLGKLCFVLRLGQHLVVEHATQHVTTPFLGELGVAKRRVLRRALGQAREQRTLRDAELLHALVEVGPCGLADAVGTGPEVDLVQVEVEDLVLGQVALDAQRQDRLADLARVGLLRCEQERLHHLLRDGARALDALSAGHDDGDRGA
jgi:hypothetical protein